MPCYRIQYSKNTTASYETDVLRCVTFCAYNATGSDVNNGPWLDCPDLLWNRSSAWVSIGRVTLISSNCTNCSGNTPPGYVESVGITPNQPFDCVNGGCVPKTTYNTPGVYASLAACKTGCAKNSTCNGECVSTAELAELQQAVSNIKSRLCQ